MHLVFFKRLKENQNVIQVNKNKNIRKSVSMEDCRGISKAKWHY